MSSGAMGPQQTLLNDPKLHPAVMTVKITVEGRRSGNVDAVVEYGADRKISSILSRTQTDRQFSFFLDNFRYLTAYIKVQDLGSRNKPLWLNHQVSIPKELRSGALKSVRTSTFGGNKVTVEIWTMLLPSVQTLPGTSTLVPSLFTETTCKAISNKGVYHVRVIKAIGLPSGDPYVRIKRNGAWLGESEVVKGSTNPIWNYVFEGLIREDSQTQIEDNKYEFEVRDWNRWTSDGVVGVGMLRMSEEPQINVPVYLYKGSRKVGTIFVSLVFRPVPFF